MDRHHVICVACVCALLCASCARVEYVPVSRVQYVTRADVRHDTIAVKDSVVVYVKGDTVIRDRWRTEYREREVLRHDTIVKADTITIVKEVEREPTRWQRARETAGGIAIALCLLIVVARFINSRQS